MITRKKKRNINNITKSLKQKNDKHIELQDYQVGGLMKWSTAATAAHDIATGTAKYISDSVKGHQTALIENTKLAASKIRNSKTLTTGTVNIGKTLLRGTAATGYGAVASLPVAVVQGTVQGTVAGLNTANQLSTYTGPAGSVKRALSHAGDKTLRLGKRAADSAVDTTSEALSATASTVSKTAKGAVGAVGLTGRVVSSAANLTGSLGTAVITRGGLITDLEQSIELILIKQPEIAEKENQDLLDTIITYEDKKQPIREILKKNISSIFAKGQTRVNLTNTSTHNERFKDYLSETASIKASGIIIADTVGVVSTAISDANNAKINYTAATESVVDDVRLVFRAIYKYVNTLDGQVKAVIKVFEACAGDFVKTNDDIADVFRNLTAVRTNVTALCTKAKEVTTALEDLEKAKLHQEKIIELRNIYTTIKVKAWDARHGALVSHAAHAWHAALSDAFLATAVPALRSAVDLIVPSITNLIADIDYLSVPVEVIIKYVECAVATSNIYNLATTYTKDVENAKKTAIALSDAYTKVSNINLSVLTANDIKNVNDALIVALPLSDSDETEQKHKLATLSTILKDSKATTTAQKLANDIVQTIIYIKTAETSAALVVEHAENVVKQYNNPDPPAAAALATPAAAAAGAVAAAPAAATAAGAVVAATLPAPPILATASAATTTLATTFAATLAATTLAATTATSQAATAAAATATSADKAIAAAAKAHKASAKLAIDIVKAVGSVMPEKTTTAITKANASAITAEESAKKARDNVDIVITDLNGRLKVITSLITKRTTGLSSQIGGGKIFSNYGARNFDQEDAIEFITFILVCLKKLDTITNTKLKSQNLLRSKYLSVLFSKIGPSQLNLLLPQIELVQDAFEEVIAHLKIWLASINNDEMTGATPATATDISPHAPDTATVTAPAPTATPAKNISELNFLLISNAGSLMSTIIDIIMTPEQLQGNENKIANNLDRKFEMAFKMPSDEEKRRVENYELLKALKYILNDQETKPISVMKQFKERISQIDTLIDSMNEGNISKILQQVALKLPLTTYNKGGYLYSIPDSFKKKIYESKKDDDDSGEAIQELITALDKVKAEASDTPVAVGRLVDISLDRNKAGRLSKMLREYNATKTFK